MEEFPVVQWLGPNNFIAEGLGSIPGQRTKIPKAMQHGQKEKEKEKMDQEWLRIDNIYNSNQNNNNNTEE